MSDPGQAAALVCGFSDLAAGLGGVAWDLGERGGLLLERDEVKKASVEISKDDTSLRVVMEAGSASAVASLDPLVIMGVLEEPPEGSLTAKVCKAQVQVGDSGRTLQCLGHVTSLPEIPHGGTLRHLAIEGPGESVLLAIARGKQGAEHGEEDVSAWRLDSEGNSLSFEQALLSTQYDKEGRSVRVGLELWPEEEGIAPMRAAGTRLGGAEADGLATGLFRCSTEGSPGLGSYLIARG